MTLKIILHVCLGSNILSKKSGWWFKVTDYKSEIRQQ